MIKACKKQVTHNAFSHHPQTDDLSSGPPAPGQLSPVYMLSVVLYGMGWLLGHLGSVVTSMSPPILHPSSLLAGRAVREDKKSLTE